MVALVAVVVGNLSISSTVSLPSQCKIVSSSEFSDFVLALGVFFSCLVAIKMQMPGKQNFLKS